MWINKIGNKSASFINHKHFHPGNIKNLERVWLAEENEKKRKEEEEKYLKKREEQYKLYELKKQLRKNEEENKNDVHNILYDINKELKKENSFKKKILHNSISNETTPNVNIINKILIRSKYDEDIFLKNHRSIYGSYYDKEKNKWGFKCCKNIDKNSKCTNNTSCSYNINNNLIKKDLTKSKNKKKKKKKLIVDNSITAVLNKI